MNKLYFPQLGLSLGLGLGLGFGLVGGKDNLTRAILFIIYAYATDASLPVNGRHRKIRVIKQSIRGFCRYQVKCWMNGS